MGKWSSRFPRRGAGESGPGSGAVGDGEDASADTHDALLGTKGVTSNDSGWVLTPTSTTALTPLGTLTQPTMFPVDQETPLCGLGPCTPKWLQVFASKQVFLIVFCFTWVLQGMYYTYFVSVITTIEKLFQIQSKTTGIIMSATEIGQIGSALLLTYYGGQGHRPKWIAWGMVLFALSSFTCSVPHYLYGKRLIQVNDAMLTAPAIPNVCRPQDFDNVTKTANICMTDEFESPWSQGRDTRVVLAIFFISLLGVGMGQTAVCTLGIPYIDDNVASCESPLYFAITIGVRILGPALGFILGSVCTRLYADLSIDPPITPKDPRWVGAWWLGLVLVSTLLLLTSFAMFSFPKRLSTCRPSAINKEKKNPSIRDFPKTVKRLLNNDILMFRTASSVLHILPIAGVYTFLPKYLESQFRLPAHTANMISGVGGILVMGVGIILSGVWILRMKPTARFVAGWIAFTAAAYALGMVLLMFVGCPMDDFAGLSSLPPTSASPNELHMMRSCKVDGCHCDLDKFSPICGQNGLTYLSACHAGCHNSTIVDDKIVEYSECSCLAPFNSTWLPNGDSLTGGHATIGLCPNNCDSFIWYIILFSLFVFIHSTSEVGSMLLILRCVDPSDKAMALGLIQFAIGLFGNVPCPIVYGAVVDSACLVWETACGEKGACRLYDNNMFRRYYHGITGGILFLAFCVDLIVWYKASNISFIDEPIPPGMAALGAPTTGGVVVETNGNLMGENGELINDKPRSETSV